MNHPIGRLWQVDTNGIIQNDAQYDKALIPPHTEIIQQGIHAYEQHIEPMLHSIYLTGSVARGMATPIYSDVNLVAVIDESVDFELVMRDWIADAEESIWGQHANIISNITLELWTPGWLFGDDEEFSIYDFILKCNSICLWGANLWDSLPNFNIHDQEIRLAIANEDILYFESDLQNAIQTVESAQDDDFMLHQVRDICKRILWVGFGLTTVHRLVYSRDVDICARYFAAQYPNKSTEIKRTLTLVQNPDSHKSIGLDLLHNFGQWVLEQAEHWLNTYNLNRYKSFRFSE